MGKLADSNHPFGNPDGSRADISEIEQGFVSFDESWGGLSTREYDLTARVIVGRVGSGKTVYLRRIQAHTAKDNSLYSESPQNDPPPTDTIQKFSHLFSKDELVEKWALLWRRAIIRSLLSHYLRNETLRACVSDEDLRKMHQDYPDLVREFRTTVSVYSQVNEIVSSHHSKNGMNKFLNNPRWDDLEAEISKITKSCKPICLYIDGIDENFDHAPMYWVNFQLGLFRQTMNFLRDSRLGGRLHLFICIRDLVLASVFRTEHHIKYITEPHIRILNWNKNAISYFLNEKIQTLDENRFLGDPQIDKDVQQWLGLATIHNRKRNIDEPVEQYLLRHTRLLPRDIVVLGNKLCEQIKKVKGTSNADTFEVRQKLVREVVSQTAESFGNEQLAVCANHIISNMTPREAVKFKFTELFIPRKEFEVTVVDQLKTLIGAVGKDRFSSGELQTANDEASKIFDCDVDVFSVLWQNGLLGYCTSENVTQDVVFYSEDSLDNFTLPDNQQLYVFHSCLIDSVSIKGIGTDPIVPFT